MALDFLNSVGGSAKNPFLQTIIKNAAHDPNQVAAAWRYVDGIKVKRSDKKNSSLPSFLVEYGTKYLDAKKIANSTYESIQGQMIKDSYDFTQFDYSYPMVTWDTGEGSNQKKLRHVFRNQLEFEAGVWGLDPFILKGVLLADTIQTNVDFKGIEKELKIYMGYSGPPLYREGQHNYATEPSQKHSFNSHIRKKSGRHNFDKKSTKMRRHRKMRARGSRHRSRGIRKRHHRRRRR